MEQITEFFLGLILAFLLGFLIGSILMKKIAIRKLGSNQEEPGDSDGQTFSPRI